MTVVYTASLTHMGGWPELVQGWSWLTFAFEHWMLFKKKKKAPEAQMFILKQTWYSWNIIHQSSLEIWSLLTCRPHGLATHLNTLAVHLIHRFLLLSCLFTKMFRCCIFDYQSKVNSTYRFANVTSFCVKRCRSHNYKLPWGHRHHRANMSRKTRQRKLWWTIDRRYSVWWLWAANPFHETFLPIK